MRLTRQLAQLHRYGRGGGPDAPKPLFLRGALPGAARRIQAFLVSGLKRTGSANQGGAAVSRTDDTGSNGGLKHRGRTVCSGEGILLTLSPREKGASQSPSAFSRAPGCTSRDALVALVMAACRYCWRACYLAVFTACLSTPGPAVKPAPTLRLRTPASLRGSANADRAAKKPRGS